MEWAIEIRQGQRYLALLTGIWITLVSLLGCAGVKYRQIHSCEANPASCKPVSESTNGIRYFGTATYLLIKPDYDTQTANLEWFNLADTTKTFVAEPYAYMATNTTEIEFKNGIITKIDSDSNSVAVPKALIGAMNDIVKSVLQTAAKAATVSAGFVVSPDGEKTTGELSQSIFLFKVEADSKGTTIVKQLYPIPPKEKPNSQ